MYDNRFHVFEMERNPNHRKHNADILKKNLQILNFPQHQIIVLN